MKGGRAVSLPRQPEVDCDETRTAAPGLEREPVERQVMDSRSLRRRQLPVGVSAATTILGSTITWASR